MTSCNVCGKSFKSSPSQDRKFCSKSCYYEYRKGLAVTPRKRVDRICQTCGNHFEIIPSWLKGGGGKYCSYDCLNEAKRKVRGVNHPLYKEKVKLFCKFCGEEFYRKPSEVKRSKFCSRRCQGSWTTQNISSPTSIEIKIEDILKTIEAVYHSQVSVKSWLCDFVIPDYMVVVETDGKYWHSLPKRIVLDKQKDKQLTDAGYQVLRLGEDDINKRPEWCKHQIIKVLKSRRVVR